MFAGDCYNCSYAVSVTDKCFCKVMSTFMIDIFAYTSLL